MKTIFFVNSYSGGAEKMTLNIAKFLDKEKHDLKIYIIGKDKEPINSFIPSDIPTELIKVNSFKDYLFFRLFKIINLEKPDVVFSSLMPINWRLCLASLFFSKTKVIIRANDYLHTQSFIQKVRLFISYRFADSIIMQTSEMRSEHIKVLKLKKERLKLLPNPINTDGISEKVKDCMSPFSTSCTNYTFVGRVDPIKGIDTLIFAFAELLKTQPNSHLHIIGETGGIFESHYQALLEIASTLGILSKITFHGFTKNPYVYMKFADCLVLSSRNEGLPNVVIEALYLGTPVVVTNSVPVIKRIVEEGVTGYVVEVDDIEQLASAMIKAKSLGAVASNYKPSTKQDFQKLFA